MQTQELLYRTENYSGAGVRDLSEIISYEMTELRNRDIPEYILENYDLPKELKKELKRMLALDEEYPFTFDRDEFETTMNKVVEEIGRQKGLHLRYGLWLAEVETVLLRYNGTVADTFAHGTSPVVLSNLGPDGVLFAYEELPTGIPLSSLSRVVCETFHYEDEPANKYGNVPRRLVNETVTKAFPSVEDALRYLEVLHKDFKDEEGRQITRAYAEKFCFTHIGQAWKRIRTIENLIK